MTQASHSRDPEHFERFGGESSLEKTERYELAPPLQHYQDIQNELARVALARQQAEDREQELQRQQLLARNACIAHGIENPDTVLSHKEHGLASESVSTDFDRSVKAQ